jgi:manganese transport protein
LKILSWLAAIVIGSLNAWLLLQTISGWLFTSS